jgi:hypothetical protein
MNQKNAAKQAKKDAAKDALKAEKDARKAEVFAETEGEGVGNLGKISLEVDENLDEDEEVASNVRI